jgi:predicted aspartyl protease
MSDMRLPDLTRLLPTIAAVALLALLPGIARAQVEPAPAPAIEEVLVTSPEPRYVAPTTRDRIGRIWAPVLINGKGPYRLVLDTGASRSALSERVAIDLGVPIEADAVRLLGVTGTTVAPAARLDSMEFGEPTVRNTRVPIIADAFGGADGVLGGEGLEDKRITIEFLRDRISIMRSHRQRAPPTHAVVPFRYTPNRGMRVQVQVGSVQVVGLIDTGAQMTVGNLALREALARRRGHRGEYDDVVIGITEDIQHATRARIPSIVAGQIVVRNAEIHFSDLHIFEHWRHNSQPALLIGMDVLGTLDTLVIDYSLKELQLRTRRDRLAY